MLLTTEEAAALLRVSVWTMRKRIKERKLSVIKVSARAFRIDAEELKRYQRSLTTEATPAPTAG